MFSDGKQMQPFPIVIWNCIYFGLVTVNESVNFLLMTCHRTVLKSGIKFGKNDKKQQTNKFSDVFKSCFSNIYTW
jgi:hypothetical protein